MENELKKLMSEKSDEQLTTILTKDKEKYTAEFIEAVVTESSSRNLVIDLIQVDPHKEETKIETLQNELNERRKTYLKYGDLSEKEVQREMLFAQRLSLEKLEKIRQNTSNLVWWLVVVPIVAAVIILFKFLG